MTVENSQTVLIQLWCPPTTPHSNSVNSLSLAPPYPPKTHTVVPHAAMHITVAIGLKTPNRIHRMGHINFTLKALSPCNLWVGAQPSWKRQQLRPLS